MQFYAPTAARRIMRMTLPPGPGLALPPLHWHRYQTEIFDVIRGRMLAVCEAIPSGRAIIAPGQSVTIPAGAIHRFENASDPGPNGEELVLDLSMDPKKALGDEIFFRHFYGYLDDCGKHGRSPHFFQLMTFLWEADTIMVLPVVPRFVSIGFAWFTGKVIGQWVLGLSHLYPEYYREGAATAASEPQ
ncbi:Cupin RmlC-type [Macrophomina phaseolina MS6]|uniref:Cupin RmlC-type n=1 Tax=Macrophomina phaseolina (strain MS6) TaxID=1126212 RepID=K2S9C1_MACPH|nr:Cupin RmlC-type [Macrophomina phaseolina MS6]